VEKWTTGWNVSHSVRNVKKMCFYALCNLNNHIALDKKVIFHWLWFLQAVQKQTLGEVDNWIVVWWQVVSRIFVPKIIKIWQLVFKLQSKMSGMFFLRHSVATIATTTKAEPKNVWAIRAVFHLSQSQKMCELKLSEPKRFLLQIFNDGKKRIARCADLWMLQQGYV